MIFIEIIMMKVPRGCPDMQEEEVHLRSNLSLV